MDISEFINQDYLNKVTTIDFICPECRRLGHLCTEKTSGYLKSSKAKIVNTLGKINLFIPKEILYEELGKDEKLILQQAYNAFHQEDYHTSKDLVTLLIYEDNHCVEIELTLAISNYFLKNFGDSYYNFNDMLSINAELLQPLISKDELQKLMDLCVDMQGQYKT